MTAEPEPTTEMRELPVAQIAPDPEQPRTEFDEAALQELARSIRKDGLIEPLVVRPTFGTWLLIAGERRWRAAKLAGVERVPCLIRWDVDADRAFELALAENLLREQLTPLEEAAAFRRLMSRYGLSLLEGAARVKKEPAYLEFRLRLLNLRPEYQDALKRKILTLPQAADLARVPAEDQPAVFSLYRMGRDPNQIARVISAMLEQRVQTELPVDVGEAREASDRFRTVLDEIAAKLGRCYSRKELELLGWVLDGSVDRNLEMLGLIIKQLRQLEEHLRKARARRAVRQPTLGRTDASTLE